MELSEKFGAHRRPTGVEVLHEQRNIDRAQDTVKITKQIAVPNGELARDRDRYSRRSRVLRDSPQLDPVGRRHGIRLGDDRHAVVEMFGSQGDQLTALFV